MITDRPDRLFVAPHKSSVAVASIRPRAFDPSDSAAIWPCNPANQDQLLINRKNQLKVELTNS